jgi:hypothetical protein
MCVHSTANQCPCLAFPIGPNVLASIQSPTIHPGPRNFLLRVSATHPPAVSLPAVAIFHDLADDARSAVLACSILSDRLYYQAWTFPPLQFLHFNIAQSLAVFYGRNRPDYYLTEGLPLLLTTALPFAAIGLWRSLCGQPSRASPSSGSDEHCVLPRLAWATLVVTVSLSFISHKEVRSPIAEIPQCDHHVTCHCQCADCWVCIPGTSARGNRRTFPSPSQT